MRGYVGGFDNTKSRIKSIQHITGSIASTTNTTDVTIPVPVNADNSIIIMCGNGKGSGTEPQHVCVCAVLEEDTAADKVTFSTYSNPTATLSVSCLVIEFYKVKSRQVLTYEHEFALDTKAITSVDVSKTMVSASIKSAKDSIGIGVTAFSYYLKSATEFVSRFPYGSHAGGPTSTLVAYILELY
jgi:hypothetical protein